MRIPASANKKVATMAVRSVLSIVAIFCRALHLPHSDDKMSAWIERSANSELLLAVILYCVSQETRKICAPGAKRLSPLFSKGGLGEM